MLPVYLTVFNSYLGCLLITYWDSRNGNIIDVTFTDFLQIAQNRGQVNPS